MTTHSEFRANGYTFDSYQVVMHGERFKTTIRYSRPNTPKGEVRITLTTIEHDTAYEARQCAVQFGFPVPLNEIDSAIRRASEGKGAS